MDITIIMDYLVDIIIKLTLIGKDLFADLKSISLFSIDALLAELFIKKLKRIAVSFNLSVQAQLIPFSFLVVP